MEIMKWSEAKQLGIKKYFTGKPCKQGHLAERSTSNGTCIECAIAKVTKWKKSNPDKARDADTTLARKRRQNDPAAQRARNQAYAERLKVKRIEEAGREPPAHCEVCGRKAHRICFDHCHTTGKFRGWLCDKCNVSLGNVNDDPEILRMLANYLEVHNDKVDRQAEKQTA